MKPEFPLLPKEGKVKSITFSIVISFFYSNFPNKSSTKNCEMWFDLGKAMYGNAMIKFLVSTSLIISVIGKILVIFKYKNMLYLVW